MREKLAGYVSGIRGATSAGSGSWLVLFSLAVGTSMLWTAVPLYLSPLWMGLGVLLFPDWELVVTYFAAYGVVMAARALVSRGTWVDGVLSSRLPQALAGVAGGVMLVIDSLPAMGPDPTMLGYGGAAFGAFSSACTILSASRLLKRLDPSAAAFACMGSFVVTAVFVSLLACVRSPVAAAFFALVPLVSYVLLRVSDARVPYADLRLGARGGVRALGTVRMRDVWRYCVVFLAIFLMGEFSLCYSGEHLPPAFSPLAATLVLAAAVLLLAVGGVLLQALPSNISYTLACRAAIPLIAIAVVLNYTPENSRGYCDTAAAALAFVALMLCDMLVWVIDTSVMRDRGPRGARMFAALRASMCLGVVAATVWYQDPWLIDGVKLGLGVTLVMLLASITCLPAAEVRVLPPAGPGSSALRDLTGEERSAWYDVILARGLTAREAEVFVRLIDGQESPAMARELGISTATVNTHVQHIFAKFDVHSRKELARAAHDAKRTR